MVTPSQSEIDEMVRRGQDIYDRQIRALLEPEHKGRFVVIDLRTGDYELDSVQLAALNRLKGRLPDAMPYVVRVGHPAAVKLGARAIWDRS